jgi:hypothetical protein
MTPAPSAKVQPAGTLKFSLQVVVQRLAAGQVEKKTL